jgi:hypothetical protein
MASYLFTVAVLADENKLDARLADALRRELAIRFPEHYFDFVDQADLTKLGVTLPDFQALGTEMADMQGLRLSSDCAPAALLMQVRAAIDEIVAAKISRALGTV